MTYLTNLNPLKEMKTMCDNLEEIYTQENNLTYRKYVKLIQGKISKLPILYLAKNQRDFTNDRIARELISEILLDFDITKEPIKAFIMTVVTAGIL